MAGKGFSYADVYEDDWYDQDGEYQEDYDEDEDPELSAAVALAQQQNDSSKVDKVGIIAEISFSCFVVLSQSSSSLALARNSLAFAEIPFVNFIHLIHRSFCRAKN
jgi:hypothetical protein